MRLCRTACAALGPVYDAAMDPTRWGAALDATAIAADGRGAVLVVVDGANSGYDLRAFSGVYDEVFRTGAAQHYLDHLAHHEAVEWEIIGRQGARRIMLDTDMVDRVILDQREDCRFLLEHVGVRRRIGVRLNENRAWFDGMAVQYGAEVEEVPANSLDRLRPLLPHLAKAVEIGRTFAQLRARYGAVLAVLDKVHAGLAIASAQGEVIVSNAEADRILGLGDGMILGRDNRIICRDPDRTSMLDTFIREAASTAKGEGDRPEGLLAVPRRSGGHPFLIEVAPLSDTAGEVGHGLVGSIITLIDPESPPRLDTGKFARLYGLTPAETAVCEHMVRGLTGRAIAEHRGTSPDTVKEQMSAVLAKTGVGRRSELIRLVVRTLPPIG